MCFVTTLIKKFDSPKFRPVRGSMFILAGCAVIATFIALHGWKSDYKIPTIVWFYGLGGAVYIGGAVLYMTRVPERCAPGKFDLCGASHQIFHLAVIAGAVLHFWQNYELFVQR